MKYQKCRLLNLKCFLKVYNHNALKPRCLIFLIWQNHLKRHFWKTQDINSVRGCLGGVHILAIRLFVHVIIKLLCLKYQRMGKVVSINREYDTNKAQHIFRALSLYLYEKTSEAKFNRPLHKLLFLKSLQDCFFLITYFKL